MRRPRVRPARGRAGDGAGSWAASPLPWLAALVVAYLVLPVVAYLVRLVRDGPGQVGPGLGSALTVSSVAATVSATVIALLGVPLAYLLSRSRGRTARLVGVLVQLPLALPPLMSGILLVYLVGPYTPLGRLLGGHLTDSLAGIVLAQTFVAAPFLVINARSAFAALDPALDDVAATLGHSGRSRFARVALPGALPGIGAGLLLSWLRAFGEFGATVVLAYHPYSLPVYTYVQFGSTGLPATVAPVGVALAAAAVVILAVSTAPRVLRAVTTRYRPGDPARSPAARPARPPRPGTTGRLAFDLTTSLSTSRAATSPATPQDTFRLRLGHVAGAPRLAILGASGAGKTIALRSLAGLMASHGRVEIVGPGGTPVELTRLPPEERGIGYVPQEASLFAHLTVWRQVTFGVGADPALAAYWVERLHLAGLEQRLPSQLSGGQQRRVALARALARAPRLLLLDEPFTGLDAPVRSGLRQELRELQRDTGLATVLVTHDADEAAVLADEVLVIEHGRLLQAGTQPDVYGRPAGPPVAHLLGIRNLGGGRVVERGVVETAGLRLHVRDGDLPVGTPVTWCVRSEHLRVSPDRASHGVLAAGTPGRVVDAVNLGGLRELTVVVGDGLRLTVRTLDGAGLGTGSRVRVEVPATSVTTWPDPAPADGQEPPVSTPAAVPRAR